jgi:RNA polymerase sigma-70 factor (ECF subfamily)
MTAIPQGLQPKSDVLPDLLSAAQLGDASAQALLYQEHRAFVARHVLRMTGDAHCVEDLVQEVFIAAFTALPGFRRHSCLQTWLYAIATNKVRNWWASTRRRNTRESLVAASRPPAPVDTPEDDALATDHRRQLYDALGRLPDKLREAFTLRAISGLDLREASEVLGVPISTVSYRTRRAEALLCAELGIAYEEPA